MSGLRWFASILFSGVLLSNLYTLAQGAEVLAFDLSRDDGEAGDPVASGFLGGWRPDIPDSLILPLKPSAVEAWLGLPYSLCWALRTPPPPYYCNDGCGTSFADPPCSDCTVPDTCAVDCYKTPEQGTLYGQPGLLNRANLAECTIVLPAFKYFNPAFEMNPDHTKWWPCFRDSYLADVIDSSSYIDSVYGLSVLYDCMPEPNAFWFKGSPEDHERLWEKTYNELTQNDSAAVLVGPNYHYPNIAKGEVGDYNDPGWAYATFEHFLAFADSTNTWPKVIGWHSFDNNAPEFPGPCDSDIAAELDSLKNIVANLGRNVEDQEFAVGEWECGYTGIYPGFHVEFFARSEVARKSGLKYSSLSGSNMLGTAGQGTLAGLLKSISNPNPHYNRSYAWWLHKAYADMSGTYVLIDEPGANYDGLASVDEEGRRITVLVGGYTWNGVDLTVRLSNLDEVTWLNAVDIIQVRCSRYPGEPFAGQDTGIADTSDVAQIVPFKEFRLLTPVANSLDIDFFDSEVIQSGQAVSIEIAPAVPDTVSVSQ